MHSSHSDSPMNDRHVQTECTEWGLWTVPAGSAEPDPECQRKRPLQPKLFNKARAARPLFSLACLHDPDRQSDDGGTKKIIINTKQRGQQHARGRNEKETSCVTIKGSNPGEKRRTAGQRGSSAQNTASCQWEYLFSSCGRN